MFGIFDISVDPSFPLVLYSLLCFGCILHVDNVVSIPSLPLICQHFVARSPGRQARAALDLQHHPTFPSSFSIFQRFKAETGIQYFVRRGQDSILIERAPCRSPSHPTSQSVPFLPFRAVQNVIEMLDHVGVTSASNILSMPGLFLVQFFE